MVCACVKLSIHCEIPEATPILSEMGLPDAQLVYGLKESPVWFKASEDQ